MNGRCETDPFDQAIDVCGSCYGEFCSQCLVQTKGRKHPICRDCAIILSGVRPGAKPPSRGSKKTAKQRRLDLKAAPVEEAFRYFDNEPARNPTGDQVGDQLGDQGTDWSSPAETAQPLAGAEPGGTEDLDLLPETATADVTAQPVPASAIDQLDRIRAGDADPGFGDGAEQDSDHPVDDPAAEFRGPRPFIETDDGPRGMAALLQHLEAQQKAEPIETATPPGRSASPATGPQPQPLPSRRQGDPEPVSAANGGAPATLPRRHGPPAQPVAAQPAAAAQPAPAQPVAAQAVAEPVEAAVAPLPHRRGEPSSADPSTTPPTTDSWPELPRRRSGPPTAPVTAAIPPAAPSQTASTTPTAPTAPAATTPTTPPADTAAVLPRRRTYHDDPEGEQA